jgi:peptidoglycan hydrolase-like protein with peptidoglycan-binding domain
MSGAKEDLVARVSYLKPAVTTERPSFAGAPPSTARTRRFRRGPFIAGVILLLAVVAAGVVALIFVSAKGSLTSDSQALARIGMPLGGGTVESVSVTTGHDGSLIPVTLRGDQIWPKRLIPAHKLLQVEVVIKRPGWNAWLAGKTETLRLTLMTPSASIKQHNLTLKAGAPIVLRFKQPIRTFSYGPDPQHLTRHVLRKPLDTIRLPRPAAAGTLTVAAAPRAWEKSPAAIVSWFPAGVAAGAVASPAPGSTITPHTNITLTFNKPINKALGASRPPVSPMTPGVWHVLNDHVMVFKPVGYGYGLGAKVQIALPNGTQLAGGQQTGTSNVGTWTVPGGSTIRLQQLLSQLGYLPFDVKGAHVPLTPSAQESAALKPPKMRFDWKYPNIPDALRSMWSPGASGTVTKGALMMFQNDHGLTPDGAAGPAVWRSLINAVIAGKHSTFGYTWVNVSLSGQSLSLWHNGHTVINTAVNTGIPGRATDPGTFPVYSHLQSTTMSGINPDGTPYNDPGVLWVSYFNGGDALHYFARGSYGSPQSLGCVEMPLSPAAAVWPYTPVGAIVHVA